MSIILASASPRRAELLRQLQLEFEIVPADVDESKFDQETVTEYVQRIARLKAATVRERYASNDVIIAADTVVCLDERVYGKPANEADGTQMLASLSGQTHIVYTAVVVSQETIIGQALSTTEVSFREISPLEAQHYWRTGEPCDKAGGYAIQGLGAVFVSSIRGSYTGVVGLPLYELTQLLRETTVQILE